MQKIIFTILYLLIINGVNAQIKKTITHESMTMMKRVGTPEISPDGKWVVSGSKDRGVQFWNPADGQPQFMLQGHKNSGISHSILPSDDSYFSCT